jgi:hypothetical protein
MRVVKVIERVVVGVLNEQAENDLKICDVILTKNDYRPMLLKRRVPRHS